MRVETASGWACPSSRQVAPAAPKDERPEFRYMRPVRAGAEADVWRRYLPIPGHDATAAGQASDHLPANGDWPRVGRTSTKWARCLRYELPVR